MKTKVRLQSSWLLNGLFDLKDEDLQERLESLKELWGENEEKVLNGLKEITGLEFARNYIDVFVVRKEDVKRSISHPLILAVRQRVESNFRVLTNELIHNLLWDNVEKDNWGITIQKLYPNEDKSTAIHVAVHAILQAVYEEVLKNPQEIKRDIELSQQLPVYRRAWEIVKEEGYQNIIAELKI